MYPSTPAIIIPSSTCHHHKPPRLPSVGISNHAGVWNISCEMPMWEMPLMPLWKVWDAVGKCRLRGKCIWVVQEANGVNEWMKDIWGSFQWQSFVLCLLSLVFICEQISSLYSFTCLSRCDTSKPLSISDDVGIAKFLHHHRTVKPAIIHTVIDYPLGWYYISTPNISDELIRRRLTHMWRSIVSILPVACGVGWGGT